MSYIMTFVFIVFYVYGNYTYLKIQGIVMVNLFEDYTKSRMVINYRDYVSLKVLRSSLIHFYIQYYPCFN